MTFPKQDLIAITEEDPPEGYEILEEGEWEQDCKRQHKEIIFRHADKTYLLEDVRSGSPFTDWNYDSEYWSAWVDCPEVKSVCVTTVIWKRVKEAVCT